MYHLRFDSLYKQLFNLKQTSCNESLRKGTGKLMATLISLKSILVIVLFASNSAIAQQKVKTAAQQPVLGYRSVKVLTINGLQFKDLNKNGKLDRYEDWR